MREYLFLTDSTCDLTPEVYEANGIERFMLHFYLNDKEYPDDGKTLFGKEFYDMMRDGKVITTSLPNMVESEKTLRAILDAGNDILFLSFPAVLSGTFQATELLMKQLAGQYADRTLIAVDTLCASAGQGLLVVNTDKCTGCRRCELNCTLVNDGCVSSYMSRVKVTRNLFASRNDQGLYTEDKWTYYPDTCRQCADPACAKACPMKAIYADENGIKRVDTEKCVGCGMCTQACPWHMPTVNPITHKSSKCIQCVCSGLPFRCAFDRSLG